jgi:hypothetical protein
MRKAKITANLTAMQIKTLSKINRFHAKFGIFFSPLNKGNLIQRSSAENISYHLKQIRMRDHLVPLFLFKGIKRKN